MIRWAINQGIEKAILLEISEEITLESKDWFKIKALGPLKINISGKEFDYKSLRNPKISSFLRFLIANRNKKIDKDIILDKFWPNMDPKKAANNFSSTLYFLRKTLDQYLIEKSSSKIICFEKGLCWIELGELSWIDVDEFEDLIKKGNRFYNLKSFKEGVGSYIDAVRLYEGAFMEEYPYDDFLMMERERLKLLWIRAVNRVMKTSNNMEIISSKPLSNEIEYFINLEQKELEDLKKEPNRFFHVAKKALNII